MTISSPKWTHACAVLAVLALCGGLSVSHGSQASATYYPVHQYNAAGSDWLSGGTRPSDIIAFSIGATNHPIVVTLNEMCRAEFGRTASVMVSNGYAKGAFFVTDSDTLNCSPGEDYGIGVFGQGTTTNSDVDGAIRYADNIQSGSDLQHGERRALICEHYYIFFNVNEGCVSHLTATSVPANHAQSDILGFWAMYFQTSTSQHAYVGGDFNMDVRFDPYLGNFWIPNYSEGDQYYNRATLHCEAGSGNPKYDYMWNRSAFAVPPAPQIADTNSSDHCYYGTTTAF